MKSDFIFNNGLTVNEEEKSIVHVITNESINRYHQIVRMDGIDATNYAKNPVVFFNHDSDKLPVGRNMWLKDETINGIKSKIAKTQFHDSEFPTTVFNMWKDKFINASSIGFGIHEIRPYYDGDKFVAYDLIKTELYEYSIVGVGANPDAVRLALEKYGENMVTHSMREMLESPDGKNKDFEALKSEFDALKNKFDSVEQLRNSIEEVRDQLNKIIVENVAKERQAQLQNIVNAVVGGAFSDVKK